MINKLRGHYKLCEWLSALNVARSIYSYRCQRAHRIDTEQERLKAKVIAIYQASRGVSGARRISSALKQQSETVGRSKARSLLNSARLAERHHVSLRSRLSIH